MKLSKETLLNLSYYVFLDDDENEKTINRYLVFLFQKYGKRLKHFYRHLHGALNPEISIGVSMSFCYSTRIGIYLGLPI